MTDRRTQPFIVKDIRTGTVTLRTDDDSKTGTPCTPVREHDYDDDDVTHVYLFTKLLLFAET